MTAHGPQPARQGHGSTTPACGGCVKLAGASRRRTDALLPVGCRDAGGHHLRRVGVRLALVEADLGVEHACRRLRRGTPRVARAIRSSTAASSSSSGTTRLIKPHSTPSAGSRRRSAPSPVPARPIWRPTATSGVWQNSPPRPPGSAARPTRRPLRGRTLPPSWHPAAVASACTLAITTCGMRWTVFIMSVQTWNRRCARGTRRRACHRVVAGREHRGRGRRESRRAPRRGDPRSAASSSSIVSRASTLRFSGLSSVTWAITPRPASFINTSTCVPMHPEYVDARTCETAPCIKINMPARRPSRGGDRTGQPRGRLRALRRQGALGSP